MARFLNADEASARAALSSAGVEVVTVDVDDVPEALLEGILPPEHRAVKGIITAEPPETDPDTGMGAWHVNAVDEVHLVTSGEGVFEFVTDRGIVAVLVGAGDAVAIRGAEHRYRPLSSQGWVLRFAGDDLGARETGRPAAPWPAP
jgi:mannose-6-phosphate isomerase-like protein (cupin superfamily)